VPVLIEIEGERVSGIRVERHTAIRGKSIMEPNVQYKAETQLNIGDIHTHLDKILWKERGMAGLQGTGGVLISEKHFFWLSSFHDGQKFARCGLFDHD